MSFYFWLYFAEVSFKSCSKSPDFHASYSYLWNRDISCKLYDNFFSADFRSITPEYAGTSFVIGDIVIPYIRLAVFAICIFVTFLLSLFLNKTWHGKSDKSNIS